MKLGKTILLHPMQEVELLLSKDEETDKMTRGSKRKEKV
jgi:hypothetical protein